MLPPATQFLGLHSLKISSDCSLHSFIISFGINLIANATPRGTKIKSSRQPNTGIKSGIKSIGLKAYPTTNTTTNLAYHGTSRLLQTKDNDILYILIKLLIIIPPFL